VHYSSRDGWTAYDDLPPNITRMPRGMLKYAILFLLNEKETHGYELLTEIKARRWGAPGPGSVYPLLGSLESSGLIAGHDEDGRRVYRITEPGRTTLLEHSRRIREFTADRQLQDEAAEPTGEGRMRRCASKLMQTIANMTGGSSTETIEKICDLLDRARRDIYAILAEE
jgi:DNA-binding PadR family transcriptional regulator